MNRISTSTIVCTVILALIFLLSLVLRMAVPWEQVFVGNWVKFTDNDAYFYVRLLDNLSRHFPFLSSYDPYYIYPGGRDFAGHPLFFVYLMGFTAWLFGGGAPSQHTVDLVGVYFPAVLGALLVFPVFFIGRAIFNKWAGLIAAGFITLMPGEFLARTLLGNTDSHVLEIFFSTLFMLFLLLSAYYGKGLAVYPRGQEYRHRLVKPLVFGALAGLFLGLYLLSWAGALFFVFISFTWLVLQCMVDHLHGRPADGTGLAGLSAYMVALAIVLAWLPNLLAIVSLAIAAAGSAVLPAISYILQHRKTPQFYYPALIAFLGITAVLFLFVISPQAYAAGTAAISGFFSWQYSAPIAEMQPLLIQQGSFTLALAWGNYTAASVMALAALAIVIFRAIKRGEPEIVLLAAWSIITLLAALAMRRFAYYLAINVALLAGYTGWLILKLCGFKDNAVDAKPAQVTGKTTWKKAAGIKRGNAAGNPAMLALGIAVVAALVIYPNTGPLPGGDRPFFDVATKALYAPSDAWCESLDWLRNNTPEPFGNADYYYARYGGADNSSGPAASYSTLCWWDYGYWVSRIGHRIPCSNPAASDRGDWRYFMAQTTRAADNVCTTWNVRYVIINDYMINWNSGFRAMAGAAGEPSGKYFELYYRQQKDRLLPALLYYPEYYRSMAVRLYCYDGKQFTPSETAVISWEARTGADGFAYKEISGLKTFRSYEEAADFSAAQKTGNWRIVGKDPFTSPVPLEALQGYKLVHQCADKPGAGSNTTPEIKIFEYKP